MSQIQTTGKVKRTFLHCKDWSVSYNEVKPERYSVLFSSTLFRQLLFAGVLIFLLLPAVMGQSVFVEVLDKDTYRGISDVEIVLESRNVSMTFYTSPDGEMTTNIPEGLYNLTFSRLGYKTTRKADIQVKMGEITSVNVFMEREGVSDPDPESDKSTKEEDVEPVERLLLLPSVPGRLFLDVGVHYGAIESARLSVGYFALPAILPEWFLRLGYANSRQSYQSALFINPELPERIIFNRFSAGAGAEYQINISEPFNMLVMPTLDFTMEFARNDGFLDHDEVTGFRTSGLVIGLDAGMRYSIVVFYVGAEYNFWLVQALNQDRNPLEDGRSGAKVKWGSNLFPDRKGLGIRAGIKINF